MSTNEETFTVSLFGEIKILVNDEQFMVANRHRLTCNVYLQEIIELSEKRAP